MSHTIESVHATWETSFSDDVWGEMREASTTDDSEGSEDVTVLTFGPALPDSQDARVANLVVHTHNPERDAGASPRSIHWALFLRQPPSQDPPPDVVESSAKLGGRPGLMARIERWLPGVPPIAAFHPVEIIEPPGYPGVSPPDTRMRDDTPTTETMASAVAALQVEVRELLEARRQDQEQMGELRERIRALEMEMADRLAEDDRGETVTDPHFDWIEEHKEELREYADRWVAIDPRRGIVAQAKDGDELAERLAALPAKERRELLAIDVRLYV